MIKFRKYSSLANANTIGKLLKNCGTQILHRTDSLKNAHMCVKNDNNIETLSNYYGVNSIHITSSIRYLLIHSELLLTDEFIRYDRGYLEDVSNAYYGWVLAEEKYYKQTPLLIPSMEHLTKLNISLYNVNMFNSILICWL